MLRRGQTPQKVPQLLSVDDLGSEESVLIKADSSVLSTDDYVDNILTEAVGVDLPSTSSNVDDVDNFLETPMKEIDLQKVAVDDFDLDSLLDDL